jgi:hypothetical protein
LIQKCINQNNQLKSEEIIKKLPIAELARAAIISVQLIKAQTAEEVIDLYKKHLKAKRNYGILN